MRLVKPLTSPLIAGATALSCGATEENGGTGSVESLDDLLREVAESLCRGDCDAARGKRIVPSTHARGRKLPVLRPMRDRYLRRRHLRGALGAGWTVHHERALLRRVQRRRVHPVPPLPVKRCYSDRSGAPGSNEGPATRRGGPGLTAESAGRQLLSQTSQAMG